MSYSAFTPVYMWIKLINMYFYTLGMFSLILLGFLGILAACTFWKLTYLFWTLIDNLGIKSEHFYRWVNQHWVNKLNLLLERNRFAFTNWHRVFPEQTQTFCRGKGNRRLYDKMIDIHWSKQATWKYSWVWGQAVATSLWESKVVAARQRWFSWSHAVALLQLRRALLGEKGKSWHWF